MKSFILLVSLLLSANAALADKMVCELTVNSQSQKIEGLSDVSIKLEPFNCRAKKEEGENIRLRISSIVTNEIANESGYRTVSENLYSADSQGDGLAYASCDCHLE